MAGSPPVPQVANSSNTSGIGSSASSSTASGLGTTSVMSVSNTGNTITTVADGGNKSNGNGVGMDSQRMNTSSGSVGAGGEHQLSRTNLYIKGLPANTTDKNLFELCSPFGTITSTKAILEKGTNNCKGT